jgi:hypothetical protein
MRLPNTGLSFIAGAIIATVGVAPPSALRAQGLAATVVSGRDADSLYDIAVTVARSRQFVIERSDPGTRRLLLSTEANGARRLWIVVDAVGDSSRITVTPEVDARGGALITAVDAMSLARSIIDASTNVVAARASDGADWPADALGRVGFVVLSVAGAKSLGARPGDTLPEIRPRDVPRVLRDEVARELRQAGASLSCTRFFARSDGYIVFFSGCIGPSPDGDRLSVYGKDNDWRNDVLGEDVRAHFSTICPPLAEGHPVPVMSGTAGCTVGKR